MPNKKERAKGPLLIKTNHEFEANIRCFFKGFKAAVARSLYSPEDRLPDAVEIVDALVA